MIPTELRLTLAILRRRVTVAQRTGTPVVLSPELGAAILAELEALETLGRDLPEPG